MLTSIKNPLVKQIRKLHHSKERHKQNLFLLEGTNLLEMVAKISYPLVNLCANEKWISLHPQLWQSLTLLAQRYEIVSEEVIKAIATTVNPDGIIATATRQLKHNFVFSDLKLGLVLERLQDPGNLGTIIRTAVATGVDTLFLSNDTVDLDHPKVLRASAGEWFRLNMSMSNDLPSLLKSYQKQGCQMVATLPQANLNYWDLDFTHPTIILMGNEGNGLSQELVNMADKQVKIPLLGGVESLNVAIATALLLYEYQRQIYRL